MRKLTFNLYYDATRVTHKTWLHELNIMTYKFVDSTLITFSYLPGK